jgi:hypothetical protein
MVQFVRSDGAKLTSVYEESYPDSIFGSIIGIQKNILDFMDEKMVNMMNDTMEDAYDRRDVDYIPTKWYILDGDEVECNLFLYTFFQRMGRDTEDGDEFTGQYSGDISLWKMEQMIF